MNFEQFLQQKGIIPLSIKRHHREVGRYEKWLQDTHGKTCENAVILLTVNFSAPIIKKKRHLCEG